MKFLIFYLKNNWDRYFSKLVEIESEQLNKKWRKLYEIRNKVAHNKSMILEEYNTAKKLCEELDIIINTAIKNIDKIKIPEKDIESIGLKTMGTIDEFTDFISNKYLSIDNWDILLNNENLKFSDDLNKYFIKINELKDNILSGNTINDLSDDDLNMINSIKIDDIISNINDEKQGLKDENENDNKENTDENDENKDEDNEKYKE